MQRPTMRGRTVATLVALGTLLAFAAVPAPAAADFHPVCEPPAAAYANMELGHRTDTGVMVFGAEVYCPSGVIDIQAALWHVSDTGEETKLAEFSVENCTSTVLEPCYDYAEVPDVQAGTLVVNMSFDVDDPTTEPLDYENVPRSGTWLWLGDGQPVPVCRSVGFFPLSVGAC